MKSKKLLNEVFVPFLINVLACIIGIAATFAGQALIDKKHDLDGIVAGLNVVKNELATNIEDLRYAHADMENICYSANYLYSHVDNLAAR